MIVYIKFSLVFFVIHFACYVIAGVIDKQLAKNMYEGKDRLYKAFFRDMEDKNESIRVAKLLIPSQLIRGLLMSFVLYPILPYLQELSFGMQFLFMSNTSSPGAKCLYKKYSIFVLYGKTKKTDRNR